MMKLTPERITSLLTLARTKRIAVIGDVMIDHYIWGAVSRISPEAPVPVVEVESESSRLGGAANVAINISSLGSQSFLIGVTGDDQIGNDLRSILDSQKTDSGGIITDPSRPTTRKTRVIAHHQHVVRIDHEEKKDIDHTIQKKIVSVVEQNLPTLDGIIIQDYNKGVVTKELIHAVIDRARSSSVPVTVDPKFNNFFEYRNVSVFKPNTKETEDALGKKIRTDDDAVAAGKILLDRLNADAVLLTRSEKGMSLFERSGSITHIPTHARRVADVSGAGDTVIATLTVMMAAGATMMEAAMLANVAGGIVCGEVGIVPIDPDNLRSTLLEQ